MWLTERHCVLFCLCAGTASIVVTVLILLLLVLLAAGALLWYRKRMRG